MSREEICKKVLEEKIALEKDTGIILGRKWKSKQTTDTFKQLLEFTSFVPWEPNNINLAKEKIFCLFNNITERPKCKYCGKELSLAYIEDENGKLVPGYKEFCSGQCNVAYQAKIEGKSLAMNSKDAISKREMTKKKVMKEKYGVEHNSQLESVRKKVSEKNKKIWASNSENRKKMEQTMLSKYGVKNAMHSEKLKRKFKESYHNGRKNKKKDNLKNSNSKNILYNNNDVNFNIKNRLFLTEERLYHILKDIFPNTNIIRQKTIFINNKKYIVDFYVKEKRLFIEFDGYHHYTKTSVIKRDKILKNYIKDELKMNIINIPYFIQIDSISLRFLFKDYLDDINRFIEKHNIIEKPNYPHGFIDKLATLPSDYCILGLEEFVDFVNKLPDKIRNEIIKSLDNKIKEKGDIESVIPISIYNRIKI